MLLLAKPISIHALREEGDTGHSLIAGDSAIFLSTPSARRATVFFQTHSWFFSYFYPRPPRGGRRAARVFAKSAMDFYPRPPRGGRLHRVVLLRRQKQISIHALREEGDPRPSLSSPLSTYFYPRPPRGGRHDGLSRAVMFQLISIHALREEGDGLSCLFQQGEFISIHALREEGDHGFGSLTHLCWKFLSTPSARRATMILPMTESRLWLFLSTPSARRATETIPMPSIETPDFYPRPPRGGRPSFRRQPACRYHFYPRPPRGGRPCCRRQHRGQPRFLSTPSARRATIFHEDADTALMISIHALREEGDQAASFGEVVDIIFLSTPSARRATPWIPANASFHTISIHALREEGDFSSSPTFTLHKDFYPRPPRGGRLQAASTSTS